MEDILLKQNRKNVIMKMKHKCIACFSWSGPGISKWKKTEMYNTFSLFFENVVYLAWANMAYVSYPSTWEYSQGRHEIFQIFSNCTLFIHICVTHLYCIYMITQIWGVQIPDLTINFFLIIFSGNLTFF